MSCEVTFMPIGHVTGGRKEATKDGWGNNRSRIELDGARFKPDALLGIEERTGETCAGLDTGFVGRPRLLQN